MDGSLKAALARPLLMLRASHLFSKEIPMWSNHPYAAHHLSNERQDRLRRVSQRTRLLHDVRRDKGRQHMKT